MLTSRLMEQDLLHFDKEAARNNSQQVFPSRRFADLLREAEDELKNFHISQKQFQATKARIEYLMSLSSGSVRGSDDIPNSYLKEVLDTFEQSEFIDGSENARRVNSARQNEASAALATCDKLMALAQDDMIERNYWLAEKQRIRLEFGIVSKNVCSQIPNTKLFVTAGPLDYQVARFLSDAIYETKTPIENIVILGGIFGSSNYLNQDSSDYFVQPGVRTYKNTSYDPETASVKVGGHLRVAVKSQRDTEGFIKRTESNQFTIQDHLVTRKLVVSHSEDVDGHAGDFYNQKVLKAYVLKLTEDYCERLDFASDAFKQDFWDLYEKTQIKNTVLHCNPGDKDKVGYLVLMFEIIRNYNAIFANKNVAASIAVINNIINRIRTAQPHLIATKDQVLNAVHNGWVLYQHGLSKTLQATPVVAGTKSPITPLRVIVAGDCSPSLFALRSPVRSKLPELNLSIQKTTGSSSATASPTSAKSVPTSPMS